MQQFH
jgi:autophagy-related protein 5